MAGFVLSGDGVRPGFVASPPDGSRIPAPSAEPGTRSLPIAPIRIASDRRSLALAPPAHELLRPRRFRTRRRLFLAFAALATAFVAAAAFQIAELDGMKKALGELHEQEDVMLVALELESAVRGQFLHQARYVAGEPGQLAAYRQARAQAAELLRTLSSRVEEGETRRWVEEIEIAVRELDRMFQDEVEPAVLARAPEAMLSHERTYQYVFRVEEAVDHLFGLIRHRTSGLGASLDETRAATVRLAIALGGGTLFVALALALYLSRSIARPLSTIGAGAARIAGGDLSTRIHLAGADEFGTLAAQVNDMAATLQREQEELVRSEKLAGVGRVAAGIAHEINNPLQVILGYLSLHRDQVPGELGQHLARVEREATRCKEIVESLLQLSRPAAWVETVPVDLRQVAEEVADALRMSDCPTAAVRVVGEAVAIGTVCRIQQIVLNLARNAAEAMGPRGVVRIDVGARDGWAEVAVKDTGPGISPELQERVFEPFFSTKSGGTGLGLAISRALADSLGGDLRLGPNGRGGACFTLRVPAAGRRA